MRKIIRDLDEYCKLNDLEVHIDKTKVVIFRKEGHGHNNRFTLPYKNTHISVINEYEYLGILFTHSDLFEKTSRAFMQKARLANSAAFSLIIRVTPNL